MLNLSNFDSDIVSTIFSDSFGDKAIKQYQDKNSKSDWNLNKSFMEKNKSKISSSKFYTLK